MDKVEKYQLKLRNGSAIIEDENIFEKYCFFVEIHTKIILNSTI